MPAEMEDPLADVARSFYDTMPKANGGYMAQMDPSTQMVNQAIMDNQMLAMGIDPEDPYYNRLYQGGGYMNVLAAGGELFAPGGNNDKLTRIDAGGTHEENPLGGVPMGPDASVEEKETIQKRVEPGTDFVFSERLPEGGITPEMAQDAGLPKFTIGKSFAKASKMVEDRSSRSGDILDRNTREVTLARLRDAQEEHKEIEFQNQLAELEDKFGKSAMPMEQPMEQPAGQGMQMPGMMPASEQEAMIQQMQASQGIPAQPSPQEMAMMQQMQQMQQQQGMPGQRPPVQMAPGGPNERLNALLSGLGTFPSNPEDPSAAYMDLARSVYGDNNLQDAMFMAYGLQGSGIPYEDTPTTAAGPRVGMSPDPTVDPSQINPTLSSGIPYATPAGPRAELLPEVPAFQPREGFDPNADPVTEYTGITPTGDISDNPTPAATPSMLPGQGSGMGRLGLDEFGRTNPYDPVPLVNPASPYIPPTLDISDQEVRDAYIRAFGTTDGNIVDVPMEEELSPETPIPPAVDYNVGNMGIYTNPNTGEIVVPRGSLTQEEFRGLMQAANDGKKDLTLEDFQNPYRSQILSDAGMKFLQGIKDIRERDAADYMLHADYDPILFPIEEQRKAISNMSAATKKQLSRRVNNPALYLAMAGTIDAKESAETAKLFETKFQVEAADSARIRELLRQDREANVQMQRLVDELNERDRQGKEQLLIEAANSFSNAYSGFAKEDFYAFMAEQYLKNADLLANTETGKTE